jgi:bifunctional non-homologous end joining protein LigD
LIEVARAEKKADALASLEAWKTRHPDVVPHLQPADVLVDAMRGRFHTWTRIRINLQHVPEALRPAQEALASIPSVEEIEKWKAMKESGAFTGPPRRRPSRARKPS